MVPDGQTDKVSYIHHPLLKYPEKFKQINSVILNGGGLRNKKEFVNHKILDFIGDIYLSGYKVIAKIKCKQGGHKLTNQLLRRVFENNSNFSIIEIKEKNLPHTFINRNFLKSIA